VAQRFIMKSQLNRIEIDISAATEKELLQIPGIGPALAREIIAARQNIIIPTGITDQTGQEVRDCLARSERRDSKGCQ
jgi:predicted DNA-binding helix-hairpin-helix protein